MLGTWGGEAEHPCTFDSPITRLISTHRGWHRPRSAQICLWCLKTQLKSPHLNFTRHGGGIYHSSLSFWPSLTSTHLCLTGHLRYDPLNWYDISHSLLNHSTRINKPKYNYNKPKEMSNKNTAKLVMRKLKQIKYGLDQGLCMPSGWETNQAFVNNWALHGALTACPQSHTYNLYQQDKITQKWSSKKKDDKTAAETKRKYQKQRLYKNINESNNKITWTNIQPI